MPQLRRHESKGARFPSVDEALTLRQVPALRAEALVPGYASAPRHAVLVLQAGAAVATSILGGVHP